MDAKDTIGENGADGPDMPRLRGSLPLGRAKVGRPKDPQKSRLTNAPVLLANADGRGEFVKEPFRRHGISYEVCKQPKSDLFRDMLPLLNSGRITLPRHDRLIAQIVGLERRVSRAGRDSIDHAPGGHDDIANAVSGVVGAISRVGTFVFEFWHDDRGWNGGAPSSDDLLWFLRR